MKTKTKFISAACIAALTLCASPSSWAKEKKAASPAPAASASPGASAAASPAAKAPRALPFHGKISTVDQTAKTFSIAGKEATRVFKIVEVTVITKDGNPGTMADMAADQDVRGSYWKREDGSLEAKTVKLGQKSASGMTKPKTKKKKAASESMASPSPAASPIAPPKAKP
jgi:hypothetical protein